MKKMLSALCLAAVLGTGAAEAQRIDSPYRFLDHEQFAGLYAGHTWMSGGALDMGPESAITVGGRWAYRVSGPFSIAVETGFTPTTRTVRDTAFAADSSYAALGEADMKLLTVMGSLRVSLMGARTWNGLHPFVLIGGGVALDLAGSSELEEDLPSEAVWDFGTSFAGQVGAGIEWFPTQRLSVRADARNLLWKLKVPDAFLLSEAGRQRRISGSEWEQNFSLSAGVSIHF